MGKPVINQLPQGFAVDEPIQDANQGQLPEGFAIDEPTQQGSDQLPQGFTVDAAPDKMAVAKSVLLDKIAAPKQESFQEANRRRFGQFVEGVPKGLGNAAVGGVQFATDVGESAARGIEGAIYGDTMDQETFGDRLAGQVKKNKAEQAELPAAERAGIFAGEVAPYVTTGAGTGKFVAGQVAKIAPKFIAGAAGLGTAGAVGGGVMTGLSQREEAGLGERMDEAAKGAAIGAAGAGIIKGVGAVAKPAVKGISNIVSRIRSELGSKTVAKKLATQDLAKGLEREGINIHEALKQTAQEGKDLIDILDPRYATLNKGLRNLDRPETIRIADQSLKRINETTNKLQDEVLNLISKDKITPEQAGDILGRNSRKLFDNAIKARRAKVEPLYTAALEKGGRINPKQTTESGETLGGILKSPFMQDIITTAKKNSTYYANTPAGKFYGNIGKLPDNDVRVLYAVEKVLGDMAQGGPQVTGATADIAAIKANKNAIATFLDKANPTLTEARSQYARLTKDIKGEGKSLIGKYAKMYNEGRSDELTKAAMNVLKLSPTRIMRAKRSNPQEFNDLLRVSFENKITSIQPLDDGVINPKAFTKAFFSDGGKALEAATGDKEIVKGFRKLAENLDIKFQRNRISKAAMEGQAKSVRVPTGKTSAVNRTLEFIENRIISSPSVKKEFVEGLFTPQGQEMLKIIANSEKKTQEKLINNFISTILSRAATKEITENN
tara:strand:+ start:4234 stop:6405 length:2172 start_codon:yes stop_codon:yes gene_type:complete